MTLEYFQIPAGYEPTAEQALDAYKIFQQEGQRNRSIGQAAAKRTIAAIDRTNSNLNDYLEGEDLEILEAALTKYVEMQTAYAGLRRLSAKARKDLTQVPQDLLSMVRGEYEYA